MDSLDMAAGHVFSLTLSRSSPVMGGVVPPRRPLGISVLPAGTGTGAAVPCGLTPSGCAFAAPLSTFGV